MSLKLIKNAYVYTMCGEPVKDGIVMFDDKIRYAGEKCDISSYDIGEIIDAEGAYVLPGLIDAHCHVGMFEDSLGFEGDDGNEDSDPITPQLRAVDAINPFDRCFSDAAHAGVTTVVTGPGSANPIGGQFAAVHTVGTYVDEMIIKAPAAVKMALGENPKSVYNAKNQAPMTRMGTVALIRETLYKAKEYYEAKQEYENAPEDNDKPDFDIKYESLIPLLKCEIPAKIHAHRADDIATALRIADEFGINVTIEHCTDGIRVKKLLCDRGAKVMLGPTLSDRSKPELANMTFATYKELSEAGLDVAIITDHPEIPIEHLPLCACMAAANGMDEYAALAGITSAAAKNCGIDNYVGTLEAGKCADIAVFSQLPTQFGAKALRVFINGEEI